MTTTTVTEYEYDDCGRVTKETTTVTAVAPPVSPVTGAVYFDRYMPPVPNYTPSRWPDGTITC